MAIQKIQAGITGAEAADLLYNNDMENAAGAAAAVTRADKVASDLALVVVGSDQLFDNNTALSGNYSPINGGIQEGVNWMRTPLIPLDPSQSYISISGAGPISTAAARAVFYGPSGLGDFISSVSSETTSQTSQSFLIPEGARFIGISIANQVGIGNNPTASPFANTFMLNYGSELPFESYGVYVNGNKIQGVQPELAALILNFGAVTVAVRQLFDNATMMLRGRYASGTGVLNTATLNWLSSTKIPLDPAQSRISISGAGPVAQTAYRVQFWNAAGGYMGGIFSPSSAASQQSFDIPSGAASAAFTVANAVDVAIDPKNTIYADTVMINYGEPMPYEPYDPNGVYLDGSKIQGLPTPADQGNPEGFYTYQPTGAGGRPRFYVFSKYPESPDMYVRFDITNFYNDSEVVYSNQYRIVGAVQVRYSGGNMTLTGNTLITAGESECVYLTTGKVDFTGGVHGDEQLVRVDFYADGVPIDTSAAIGLTPCRRFEYRQLSTMHESAGGTKENPIPNPAHPVEAYHAKTTFFEGAKYGTYNTLTWARAGVPVSLWYHAISCIAKANGAYIENEYLDRADAVGDAVEKLRVIGARKYFAANAATGLGAQATSELILPAPYLSEAGALINPDLSCEMFIWDRLDADNKYYRKYVPSKPIAAGEKWASYMEVQFYTEN